MEFEFERRRVTKEEIRELIFREILEYHPQLLKDYINGKERTNFLSSRFFRFIFNCCLFSLNIFLFICSTLLFSLLTFHWFIFVIVLLINSKSISLILRKLVVKMIQSCHMKENTHHFPGNTVM